MIRLLRDDSDLPSDRVQEVVNSYDIGTRPARFIMVKVEDARALDIDKSFAQNMALIEELKYSRYPLVKGGFDNYLGNIYIPSLLPHMAELQEGTRSLEEFKMEKMVCDHDLDIGSLINRFQAEKQELAVLRKGNGLVGLITLTDALEAIVGQLEDPLDFERDGQNPS
jgi:CBS domain containing-hemolysin-like protein